MKSECFVDSLSYWYFGMLMIISSPIWLPFFIPYFVGKKFAKSLGATL